jgi:hypothetical protein
MPTSSDDQIAAPKGDGPPPPPTANGMEKAATWLTGGLVLFTTSLAAFGGLTGGIARMFRNSGNVWISVAILLVLLGVLLAVVTLTSPWKWLSVVLLVLSTVLFGAGVYKSLDLMVGSSRIQDRPALSAQLSGTESGWVIKVQASSSGLGAHDQLQVLVYAQPRKGARLLTPTPVPPTTLSSAPDTTLGPGPRATPGPTAGVVLSPAPSLDGDRLLFTQAGPNIDGVASQNFEVPIPADKEYQVVNVTAVIGNFPRNCEGLTVNVRDFTELLVPPERVENGQPLDKNGTLSCLTVALPPLPQASGTVPKSP